MNSSAAPHGIAITEDGSKVYVGLENADVPGVVVIDARGGKVLRKIDLLLQGGHYLAIQPGTGKLYYPHRDDDRVVVLDTKTDRVLKVVPVKGGPSAWRSARTARCGCTRTATAASPCSTARRTRWCR